MITSDPRLEDLSLAHGAHDTYAAGVCAMEAVAWLAGESHSDHPACTCPVIAAAVRRLNDDIGNRRERDALLKPLLLDLIGTRSTLGVEVRRAYVAADYAVRVFAPLALDGAGMTEWAAQLRALAPIVDQATAAAARSAADPAAADAARSATRATVAAATVAADAVAAADAHAHAAADARSAAAYAARSAEPGLVVEMIRAMIAVQP